ncbi:bifunctional proline dehydrogenase/L-glutamate gamma-semialdehyde dehydrogenase PutA [Nitrosovibrio tenuis]|uniref:Bifunctional protein PutA n=1 Tax=Nitrosovibrio tenuis TaxID=1233 RepID=A0A1H7NS39_9PROT|nr:bifunctional proline dehydrogenase/L-glutamate gamma-semialdehyde dehydrogenase PutA [Nitrosovibrio tenuis]SEL26420.1 L-proline dehydrogenase /delta-1-pyrroline-5-carboxylate dehydrogenase [Nitrosovibrio tenuis]
MHPPFAIAHLSDETTCVDALLSALEWDSDRRRRVGLQAEGFIRRIRDRKRDLSEMETVLEHYPLDSPEGLALLTLAEALLRIPDAATADVLIAEKMAAGIWKTSRRGRGVMKLAGIGMNLAGKALGSFLSDLERPFIRKTVEEAIRRIGRQFVVGENIAAALSAAKKLEDQGYRMSYDMLGEGARTAADADRYFETYAMAADIIGKAESSRQKPGMSVKLSALHPRYGWTQKDRCVPEIIDRLSQLCRRAAESNISLTVDAEEADRLEMSWEIISAVAKLPGLRGWDGFGLAIQAYDKRCFRLIDAISDLAAEGARKIQVRLVKGAYWDTEIKHAQVAGLPDYPVFTRKANTDLCYLVGVQKLLALRERIYPMFGTHNAHTVAAVLDMAGNSGGFEFQRLYGMGGALYDVVLAEYPVPVTIYAPVGSHEDLLPYLIRRLVENGANTSFVQQIRGTGNGAALKDPVEKAAEAHPKRHPRIPLPRDLYGPGRKNSAGMDLSAEMVRIAFLKQIPPSQAWRGVAVTPIINGNWEIKSGPIKSGSSKSNSDRPHHPHVSPANTGEIIADVWDTTADHVEAAFAAARQSSKDWSKTPAVQRAETLRRAADLIELNAPKLVGLLQHEGGKTILDSVSEVREAADFCRYYAAEGERLFAETGITLPGPTGEENRLVLDARGVFVCISPWNFPLAIFMGQIAGALMAGNSVIAKPAEQTPVIAFEAVRLLLDAGVPPGTITLLPGDGRIGAALVAHAAVDGVAFTGSVEVARLINRTLAAKDGPIVPFIAETGGQNAMLVDSTALPEQVIDDVVLSAFGSAGQRCSALRVLCVQDEIAGEIIRLLRGALQELRIGDPRLVSTDVGPVIDADALKSLTGHVEKLRSFGKLIGEAPLPEGLAGWYLAPVAYEIDSISRLPGEVFGPILHVIRYAAKNRTRIIQDINATEYGLTFGMHSRLQHVTAETARQIEAGNVYINRSMIGAVVGVQPFGGRGLSGTGPKAGGPYYLPRFANEKTVTVNTTVTGGNVALLNAVAE